MFDKVYVWGCVLGCIWCLWWVIFGVVVCVVILFLVVGLGFWVGYFVNIVWESGIYVCLYICGKFWWFLKRGGLDYCVYCVKFVGFGFGNSC